MLTPKYSRKINLTFLKEFKNFKTQCNAGKFEYVLKKIEFFIGNNSYELKTGQSTCMSISKIFDVNFRLFNHTN